MLNDIYQTQEITLNEQKRVERIWQYECANAFQAIPIENEYYIDK